MNDQMNNANNPADDMAEYLQTFLDETEEQLDDLVDTMLALENNPDDKEELNEAFRLIHSIKGSAGMMGFDNMSVLTHHLENRFERFRSGVDHLDQPTMNLVLRCIDFLRQCNSRLRAGEQLGSAGELLEEVKKLESSSPAPSTATPEQEEHAPETSAVEERVESTEMQTHAEDVIRMRIQFREGLPLADLKAQLIVSRLSGLGEIKATEPNVDQLTDPDSLDQFVIHIETQVAAEELKSAADVDGVESIAISGQDEAKSQTDVAAAEESVDEHKEAPSTIEIPPEETIPAASPDNTIQDESVTTDAMPVVSESAPDSTQTENAPADTDESPNESLTETPADSQADSASSRVSDKSSGKVAETMRVDIGRLDNLLNLAGELVVNRARFMQISEQVSPAIRKASMLNRAREFSEELKRTIENMEEAQQGEVNWSTQIHQLRAGLELIDEQAAIWENGRQCFNEISEAIDQLSRVSHNLQQGVLETRMVPVGPLFNRFKRIVRDLSMERGKHVQLKIQGEKTELDKRMIDELGDPLIHLVRNCIDHGLESPQVRLERGKPEMGTISMEASHSANNVFITIRDDGGGIDLDKIKSKLIDREILSKAEVQELPDEQVLEYIWHPGFSTADAVTDVSGRGVGMDAVKNRITQLNGTIEAVSTADQGTVFTIRLPLTLAIIKCLLVRLRGVIFSMPMDDVREIVSVRAQDIINVHGKKTFDVRGEFIPLININDVFHWHKLAEQNRSEIAREQNHNRQQTVDVVILQSLGKTLGLRVDELLGSRDIVIKSLSDNFIDIRGLSGASILGDGSVSLMLDVNTVISMAMQSSRKQELSGAGN